MQKRRLGSHGPEVSAIGLGCMGMSGMYGPSDRDESIATIHATLDAGLDILDTGDFYGMGHNELLIAEALKGRRDRPLLSVKFGALLSAGRQWLGYDARPAAVKTWLAYSLQRLGVDHIDIYRPARLDPQVPIEDTIGAIADEVKAGRVRYIGLSEVGADTIRRAAAVHPIVDLQIEYSLLTRGIEASILPACRDLGIAVTAYGVLGRGLIGGHMGGPPQARGDGRAMTPRFQQGNIERNLGLAHAIGEVASRLGVTTAQAAIAWALSRGDDIVPLVGARTRDRLAEALGPLELRLSAQDLAALEGAAPDGSVAGSRYPEAAMAHLDSER